MTMEVVDISFESSNDLFGNLLLYLTMKRIGLIRTRMVSLRCGILSFIWGDVVEKDLKGRDEVRSKKFLIHFLLKIRISGAGIYYQIIGQ